MSTLRAPLHAIWVRSLDVFWSLCRFFIIVALVYYPLHVYDHIMVLPPLPLLFLPPVLLNPPPSAGDHHGYDTFSLLTYTRYSHLFMVLYYDHRTGCGRIGLYPFLDRLLKSINRVLSVIAPCGRLAEA